MAYGVIESTNMKSTKKGGGRVYDAVATTDIENGTVGYIDELATGETHIYNFHKGLPESVVGKTIVIVDQPAWDADESHSVNQRRDKFICKAGVSFRVRVLYKDDEFAVSIDCFAQASQKNADVDKYVTVDTDGKFTINDSVVEDAVIEGKIMRTHNQGATLVTTANTYGYQRKLYTIKVVVA
jgi:ribosomal protein L21